MIVVFAVLIVGGAFVFGYYEGWQHPRVVVSYRLNDTDPNLAPTSDPSQKTKNIYDYDDIVKAIEQPIVSIKGYPVRVCVVGIHGGVMLHPVTRSPSIMTRLVLRPATNTGLCVMRDGYEQRLYNLSMSYPFNLKVDINEATAELIALVEREVPHALSQPEY